MLLTTKPQLLRFEKLQSRSVACRMVGIFGMWMSLPAKIYHPINASNASAFAPSLILRPTTLSCPPPVKTLVAFCHGAGSDARAAPSSIGSKIFCVSDATFRGGDPKNLRVGEFYCPLRHTSSALISVAHVYVEYAALLDRRLPRLPRV